MQIKSKKSVIALANAITLATGVLHRISGKEVSANLSGQRASREVLAGLIASRINANFSKHTGKTTS